MKLLQLFPLIFLLTITGCASVHTATVTAPPCATCVAVTFNNNYGRDLVIAIVQGADSSQSAAQIPWLTFDTDSLNYVWQLPSSPQSNADLLPYIFDIDSGQTLTINVPQYNGLVGFDCLVADTAFKQNALDTLVTATTETPYMAFPNWVTAPYVFGFFEGGLTDSVPGVWDITAVDYVGIPMQLETGGIKVGFKNGVTAEGLYNLLGALPSPYNQGGTLPPNTSNQTYRFLAPQHIPAADSVMDSAIIAGISQLNNYSGSVVYGNFTFSNFSGGKTSGNPVTGSLSCTYTNTALGVKTPITIIVDNISTANSFAGTIVGPDSASTINGQAEIEFGALLSAAICRGVLGNPLQWGMISGIPNCPTPCYYYPSETTSNAYADLIHNYSIGGKNYTFPYDDYFSDEAGFTVVAGDSVTVNILPRTGPLTATPEPRPAIDTTYLSVTIPTGSGYPDTVPVPYDSTYWQIGSVVIGTTLLTPGPNNLCSLGSDSITCTFPDFPNVTMYISVANSSFSFSGAVNGNEVTSIAGLTFTDSNSISFGASSKWITSLTVQSLKQKRQRTKSEK